ncbi:hypothetical protein BU14_1184s0001 [Porphyra umbilicalis]|uniref:Uncharacterized protein n=1 Tax=Porphyra umbilicalis TaxID=2786 RepID=A0A1X6NMH0_PORUM|nr:hypothetical protein BU14_1184s0001 [Porphyra umbilicalis]|eukprot:OSX69762.1 hypothetical protein BU14_1184s0001 [Porphyra umbilicalis]
MWLSTIESSLYDGGGGVLLTWRPAWDKAAAWRGARRPTPRVGSRCRRRMLWRRGAVTPARRGHPMNMSTAKAAISSGIVRVARAR